MAKKKKLEEKVRPAISVDPYINKDFMGDGIGGFSLEEHSAQVTELLATVDEKMAEIPWRRNPSPDTMIQIDGGESDECEPQSERE